MIHGEKCWLTSKVRYSSHFHILITITINNLIIEIYPSYFTKNVHSKSKNSKEVQL